MNLIITLFLLITSAPVAGEIRVETGNEGTIICEKIESQAGNLKLYPRADQKFNRLVSISNIKSVVQEEPELVKFLREAFTDGKYRAVASAKGQEIIEKSYQTGWGKKAAFHVVMSMIHESKYDDAERVLKTGLIQIPGENDREDQLLLRIAAIYLTVMKNKEFFDRSDLNNIQIPDTELGKTYYYQLQGVLYERAGKPSLAVLSYYKGVFLGLPSHESKLIQAKIQGIYKSQGDPRVLPDLSRR